MNRVLILGATSGIAEQLARRLAARGAALFLVSRHRARLEALRDDLLVRGASQVGFLALDLDRTEQHEALINRAGLELGGLDAAVLAYGVLGDQTTQERRFDAAQQVLSTNFVSPVSLLTLLANRFEAQRSGSLVVLSSVAGDRGRPSNYVYGASKAGLNTFLQGLRARMFRAGVNVLTVKPGMVDTPMTTHLKKSRLFASPERVAAEILRAADARRDVAYVPGIWRWVMWVIRCIPERIFKRLQL